MKLIRSITILAIFSLIASTSSAQGSNHINFGVAVAPNGFVGIEFGFNPCHTVTNHFSLEGQLSLAFKKNLSSQSAIINQGLFLGGGRLYLVGPGSGTRIYLNALAGISRSSYAGNASVDFGLSGGLYLQGDKFIAGISIEKPVGVVFKLGRRF